MRRIKNTPLVYGSDTAAGPIHELDQAKLLPASLVEAAPADALDSPNITEEDLATTGAAKAGGNDFDSSSPAAGGLGALPEAAVKAACDALDFSTLTVDDLAAQLVDQRTLKAVLNAVDLPNLSDGTYEEVVPARRIVDAMLRMAEVVAKLQSRVVLLETLIASEWRAGRRMSRVDTIASEPPTRKAIQRLELRDVAIVSATDSAFGRNWWPAEVGDDISWRWSGPQQHSTALLPSVGLEEGWVSIEFSGFGNQSLKETFARVRPTFYLDDQRIEFQGVEQLGEKTAAVLSAPFSRTHGPLPTHYVLHVHLEALQRPVDEILGSTDRRRLGLNVRRVILSAAPWS